MTDKITDLMPELAIIREVMKATKLEAQRDKWCKAYEGCANEHAKLEKERDELLGLLCLTQGSDESPLATLRAEVERLGTDIALHESLAHGYTEEIADLRAENERLREALQAVVNVADRNTVEFDLARAALQSKGEA